MTRTIRLLPMLTVLVLLGAGQARADSVDFSYQWTVQPQNIFPGGTGNVSLSVAQDPVMTSAVLGTPTLLTGATVTTSSSATSPPDSFNTAFSMTLHLSDASAPTGGDLTFSGTLAGNVTANSSTLTATLDTPFTKTLTLGDHDYTVTITPSLLNVPPPGKVMTDGTPASIDAKLTVANHVPVDQPPPPHQTPEPTSLVLGATAVLGLAARRLWLRRRDRAAV